jgi:hypothetical protein
VKNSTMTNAKMIKPLIVCARSNGWEESFALAGTGAVDARSWRDIIQMSA